MQEDAVRRTAGPGAVLARADAVALELLLAAAQARNDWARALARLGEVNRAGRALIG